MSRAPSIIKESTVTKVIRAATKAGKNVTGFEIDPITGRQFFHFDGAAPKPADDLDRELAEFEKKNG